MSALQILSNDLLSPLAKNTPTNENSQYQATKPFELDRPDAGDDGAAEYVGLAVVHDQAEVPQVQSQGNDGEVLQVQSQGNNEEVLQVQSQGNNEEVLQVQSQGQGEAKNSVKPIHTVKKITNITIKTGPLPPPTLKMSLGTITAKSAQPNETKDVKSIVEQQSAVTVNAVNSINKNSKTAKVAQTAVTATTAKKAGEAGEIEKTLAPENTKNVKDAKSTDKNQAVRQNISSKAQWPRDGLADTKASQIGKADNVDNIAKNAQPAAKAVQSAKAGIVEASLKAEESAAETNNKSKAPNKTAQAQTADQTVKQIVKQTTEQTAKNPTPAQTNTAKKYSSLKNPTSKPIDTAPTAVALVGARPEGAQIARSAFNAGVARGTATGNIISPAGASQTASAETVSQTVPGDAPARLAAASPSNQIIDALEARIIQADNQIVIRLNPPELGAVRIIFHDAGDGLRGVVEVENSRTLSEIQREMPAMLQRLAEGGVQIKQMEFQTSDNGSAKGDQAGNDAQNPADSAHGNEQNRNEAAQDDNEHRQYTAQSLTGGEQNPQRVDYVNDDSINVWI